ncbi:MAG: peptidoglycan DD-metalloendopeptidase family protein [Candidatus Merdivicinus sp.]|jgi:murein DD-endopeptidase MepM/ murein hydrolase activator NlpD
MRKLNLGKKKGLSKGFYIALAISVTAIGSATYLTLNALNTPPQETPSNTLENTTEWSIPEVDEVEKSQPGVPKDTPQVIVRESEPEESTVSAETSVPTVKKEETASTSTGAFIMPVSGEVMNPYSNGELVKSKTLNEWRTHDGIDIKAKEGTPVKSPNDGKVVDIREDSQWGNTVEIEYPNDVVIYFCGLGDDIKVKKGQEVKLGDVIGSVGNSSVIESAEEMHLHVGIKKGGEWVDPMTILTKN